MAIDFFLSEHPDFGAVTVRDVLGRKKTEARAYCRRRQSTFAHLALRQSPGRRGRENGQLLRRRRETKGGVAARMVSGRQCAAFPSRCATLVSLVLRVALVSQPMRFDESVSYVQLASHSLRTCLTVYLQNNNHPLHTLLVHFSTLLLGNHPWCLRLPALVAGVLLIPATYWTFEEIFDEASALLAAALVAASAPLVEYSTNARGYGLQAVFVVLLFGAAARLLQDPTPRRWGAFVLWTVLGFYTIPTMLYFFLATLVFTLASLPPSERPPGRRRFLAHLAFASGGAAAIVLLLYLPFVVRSGLASFTANASAGTHGWGELLDGIGETLRACAGAWHRGLPFAVALLLGVGFVVSLVASRSLSRLRLSPALATFAVCLAMMLLQRTLPPERVFVPCLPLYLGSCAAGLRWLGGIVVARAQRRDPRTLAGRSGAMTLGAFALLVAGVLGVLVLGREAAYQTHDDQVIFSDAEGMAVALKEISREGDVVYVQAAASMILRYYFGLHGVPEERLYRAGRPPATGRSFVIDASEDEPEFTVQEALKTSTPPPTGGYVLAPILELPRAKLYGLRQGG